MIVLWQYPVLEKHAICVRIEEEEGVHIYAKDITFGKNVELMKWPLRGLQVQDPLGQVSEYKEQKCSL